MLGLPVPGIILAREKSSNKLLVIDGQQRLRSLQYFIDGVFNPNSNTSTRKAFSLLKVQPQFLDKTFEQLEEADKINLQDTILHATIVKQDSPDDDDTSIYHIFERLNSGGRKLAEQEIRSAIYHGAFINKIKELNDYQPWKEIYKAKANHLKDEGLILRFLALYYTYETYKRPMAEFLTTFAKKYQDADVNFLDKSEKVFKKTIDAVQTSIGENAFRPRHPLNVAVFDSVMVGIARRLNANPEYDPAALKDAYYSLLENKTYQDATGEATSNEISVKTRIEEAVEAFRDI